MASRGQHYGFQAATTSQPANGGHAYLFGNNGSENDLSEDDGEIFELRSRGRDRLRRSASRERMDDIIYLARDVQEGDTLNSLALHYHCSVADLKRANNLLTEQDFFALRSVKIPVRRFSVLTESHNGAAAALKPSSSPSTTWSLSQISPGTSSVPTECSTDSSSSADSVEGFLLEKDKDIERLVMSTGPSSRSSLNEVVSSLTQLEEPLLGGTEYKPALRKDPYYGADWGMRWWTAVAIMLVVGIVTPVFYLLYYEVLVKADVSHHGAAAANAAAPQGNEVELSPPEDRHAGAAPGDGVGNGAMGDPKGAGEGDMNHRSDGRQAKT
ncbi:lysM and putative peptidoglycan-binding domain-containing protein 3 [Gadus morhua]|uniref:LysM and putative peptidoglycan-binding domain-containing protein 3 n=1 Tax=Gadus morhua TaxID=8049 RepID=A0A8C5BD13_GADMO|nr:lysM and putative peptidoglycan-binding domain-containing protein 3 [Gadus morhua]XP_030214965.1 lysM and putative peptidoglycan-binding domain-containing protein 3 [Gadus morhua]XP_030214966.1 lysM and putative peptidoglycan-binding domain-containing protein 3 [Gadus morhua]